jgi:hypothetical protein
MASCASPLPQSARSQEAFLLDSTRAIEIAVATAEKRGVDLAAFGKPHVSTMALGGRRVWLISFALVAEAGTEVVADPNHFTYIIDDSDQTVEVLGGK